MSDEPKLSPVEVIKQESAGLRGPIPAELRDDNDHFGKESIQLLKHHGTYQQDDRDARSAGRVEGHKGKVAQGVLLHGAHQDPRRQTDQ